ncbi:maltotransferase domain-containing protein [Streptomyces sp. 135]|uniref:maltotransferase domain-containing protein n=1 Tax=Streptomyces sp. 135 TaxID=2838850 RepID=UPI0023EECC65|nr:maltotransferase domain-containing protein [Streptomyces sp. 135]
MLLPTKAEVARHLDQYRAWERLLLADPADRAVRTHFENTAYTLCVLMGELTARTAADAAEHYLGLRPARRQQKAPGVKSTVVHGSRLRPVRPSVAEERAMTTGPHSSPAASARSSALRPSEVRSSEARSGEVRSGEVRSSVVREPVSRPAPVLTVPILDVRPVLDCGRRPVKAVPGETFQVTATLFGEGQEAVGANVVLLGPDGRSGPWTPMRELSPGSDRWGAGVTPDAEGRWTYAVEAWADPVTGWRRTAEVKIPAGIDTEVTLEEGALLFERAADGVPDGTDRRTLRAAAEALRDEVRPSADRLTAALTPETGAVLARHPLRERVTRSDALPLLVERKRALFGSWYEFFPRSEGAVVRAGEPPVPGTFRTAAERLPAVADMGFDVVYLPPVHPIGTTHRKGPNNSLSPGPHDVGVPWAIGSPEGGHDAVHPDLGTLDDFDAFVRRAQGLGMEVALDFALQCSPDHPWVDKHPEWFRQRADGSIAYAENPPKKYQDIYPIAFDTDLPGLVAETERLLRFWMGHGVRIFRVDNPHTKPVVFWEEVIARINGTDPDVIFLAEAFTRPEVMRALARVGFQQSYTYFTWRNTKQEITECLTDLSVGTAAYLRPNLFVNTPDILPGYLQEGGRPAFEVRAVLAATLSPTWGLYSGFELCENTAVRPGSEEYLNSEKYELRPRDWQAAEREGRTIAPLITTLNAVRRRHRALHLLRNLHFHRADNDALIVYSKRDGDDLVLVVANLDPHHTQEGTVSLDMPRLGLDWHESVPVRDELGGETYHWGSANYVRLRPGGAHVLVRPEPGENGGSPTS